MNPDIKPVTPPTESTSASASDPGYGYGVLGEATLGEFILAPDGAVPGDSPAPINN